MAFRKKTIGIRFPFLDSDKGDFFNLTETPEQEIKSNLIHLLLTRRGSRFMLPNFGTNLYQYLFEPLTNDVIGKIENEIIDACEKYLPNVKIDKVNIQQFTSDITYINNDVKQHQITIDIDYTINSRSFQATDRISLNF